ncbi:MAG: serine hydrolase, partial [Acidobacteriota bacterium]
NRIVILLSTIMLLGCGQREYFKNTDDKLTKEVDSYLGAIMASRPIPGIAVGIVKGDRLIFSKGYGTRHLQEGGDVVPEMVFHTASVSKTFVATAIMQLVEKGQIELDAPVTRYLPHFTLADNRAQQITIGHLLSHTSGMASDIEGGEWWKSPELDELALDRFVRSLSNRSLLSQPGEKWHYSNLAYEVLGDVIAKVSGKSFEEYIDSNILKPLGMTNSTFLAYQGQPAMLAWPHRGSLIPDVSTIYPYNRARAPSSALKSNVPDLARWLAMNLNKGEVQGTKILSSSLLEKMWQSQAEVDGSEIEMGLGWFLREHRGSRMVVGPGTDPGFHSLIGFLPEHSVGVIVLMNYDGQSRMEAVEIADGILDIGLGRKPEIPSASIAIPLAKVLARSSIEATIDEYHRLKKAGDKRYKNGTSDLITLGHELYKQQRFAEALQLYSLNATEHPEYFYSYIAIAKTYLKMGDEKRAAEYYQQGIAHNPERWGCPPSCYQDEALEKLIKNNGH